MVTINAPKTATANTKRGIGQTRPGSGETQTTHNLSIITGSNAPESILSEPLKIITEVDGRSIEYSLLIPLFVFQKPISMKS